MNDIDGVWPELVLVVLRSCIREPSATIILQAQEREQTTHCGRTVPLPPYCGKDAPMQAHDYTRQATPMHAYVAGHPRARISVRPPTCTYMSQAAHVHAYQAGRPRACIPVRPPTCTRMSQATHVHAYQSGRPRACISVRPPMCMHMRQTTPVHAYEADHSCARI